LEQLNGHPVEPETRAEPEAKANAPDPVVPAPESDPLPPSEQPGSSPKEKEKENGEEEAVAGLSAAEASEGSAASAPLGAEAKTEIIVHVTGEATAELNGVKSEETPQQPTLSGDGPTLHGDAAVEKVSAEGASDAAAIRVPHHAPPPPPRRHPLPVRPTERQALPDMASLNDDRGAADHHSHSRSKLGGEKPEEQQGFAPDGTPFVGDGTWEERTWKELTRLREDMFWARVGGAQ
jgi:hypothetical protein